jgi:hypothetical protein
MHRRSGIFASSACQGSEFVTIPGLQRVIPLTLHAALRAGNAIPSSCSRRHVPVVMAGLVAAVHVFAEAALSLEWAERQLRTEKTVLRVCVSR